MPWYAGPTLLEHLETIEVAADRNLDDRRFPVQWVIRPMADSHPDYRGYAGQVASGVWRAGDEVVVLPSGSRTRVAAVEIAGVARDEALPDESVTILLEDDVDVSRGDLLADPERPPIVARELVARVSWMAEKPLEDRARLLIKQTTRTVPARAEEILSVVDIETLQDRSLPGRMELNDLGVVRFRLAEPLVVDSYKANRWTGSFILIDESSNDTVGAGMVVEAREA
jgi:sulfate adenylyltransferase subunit 1 (EFTu-like GTPase family)